MIRSKEDLDFYLAEDSKRYNVRFFDRFIFNENYHILKYLRVLRKLEYYQNCTGGVNRYSVFGIFGTIKDYVISIG